MIDVDELKRRINLLELIGSDTRLRKIASTRGGEYAGPCPFCGGDDRFRVQPEQGLWWCRSCGDDRWQDAVAYVMRREGLSFFEAARALGGDLPMKRGPLRQHQAPVEPPREPSEAWRQRGLELVLQAVDGLWSKGGARARSYLYERGLNEDTLRCWVVGYIPEERYEDPEAWGFTPQ